MPPTRILAGPSCRFWRAVGQPSGRRSCLENHLFTEKVNYAGHTFEPEAFVLTDPGKKLVLTDANFTGANDGVFTFESSAGLAAFGLQASNSSNLAFVLLDAYGDPGGDKPKLVSSVRNADFSNSNGLTIRIAAAADAAIGLRAHFDTANFSGATGVKLECFVSGKWGEANFENTEFDVFRIAHSTVNPDANSTIQMTSTQNGELTDPARFVGAVFPPTAQFQGVEMKGVDFTGATLATTPAGSCEGLCEGGGTSGSCSCDASCFALGNCCADICEYCVQSFLADCPAPLPALSNPGFTNVTLSNVNFTEADLTDQDVSDLKLTGVNFESAILDNVLWQDTICPNGENSSLSNNSCCGTPMLSTPASGCTVFTQESLTGVSFAQGVFQNAVFAGLDLQGQNFNQSSLEYTDFSGADLTGADLSFTGLQGTNFDGAILNGVNLEGANLAGVNLSNATLDSLVQPALAACPGGEGSDPAFFLPEGWLCINGHLWGPGVVYTGRNFTGTPMVVPELFPPP